MNLYLALKNKKCWMNIEIISLSTFHYVFLISNQNLQGLVSFGDYTEHKVPNTLHTSNEWINQVWLIYVNLLAKMSIYFCHHMQSLGKNGFIYSVSYYLRALFSLNSRVFSPATFIITCIDLWNGLQKDSGKGKISSKK